MRGAFVLCLALCAVAPVAAQERVDLIVHNGTIFTADPMLRVYSAMAVREGRIVAVGRNELRQRFRADRELDLEGAFVLPGFHDTHTHIRGYPRRHVDMAGVGSLEEFGRRLRSKADELPPGAWITGYGWAEEQMAEGRKPTRYDLDRFIPRNPAVIARAGGHSAVVNGRALELAGIDASTPDPEGGVIERDSTGEPTGIILENWSRVGSLVPEATKEEIRESLVENLRGQFAHGITSVIEAMTSPEGFALWQQIYERDGGLLPRAAVQIHLPVGFGEGEAVAEALRRLAVRTGDGDHRLRVGALKLFVDGGFTGPAAWTLEHYRDQPDYYGHARLRDSDFYEVARPAHELGWQLGVHAIGDAAIRMAVDQLVRILEDNPRPDHRHYLNHFTVLPPERTMQLMADHNIGIAQQPNFTWTLEKRYSDHLVGERLQTNNALRTPMSNGIFVALGADILPTGPLRGIHAAVTRRGMSGAVYGKEERLTIPEALVGYTRNGAYLTHEEHVKGTLAPGMFADFVVLSHDLRRIDPEMIPQVRVLETYLGGVRVYSAEETETVEVSG